MHIVGELPLQDVASGLVSFQYWDDFFIFRISVEVGGISVGVVLGVSLSWYEELVESIDCSQIS